ncbi:MAG: CHAD domain-containing protein [Candidatus Competibacter sp.]|nr:CHAD domain-containing protein [Candidatus Competibacter sp.]
MNSAIVSVKARPLQLEPNDATEEAFIAVIDACLRHAEANLPAVLDGQVEGVHQMRVAFRRLRSGLKLFRSLVPREASAELVDDLRWLNGFLGPARDWDVFLQEGLATLFDHFPRKRGLVLFRGKAETIRRTRRRALRQALSEPRYPTMLRRFADWLERRAWRDRIDDERRQRLAEPALAFSTPLLERNHRRVVKRGEAFAELSAEARHGLRIRIKELRYALDFFASCYPSASVKAYLAALSQLQDSLGIMNDAAVAHRLLDEMGLTSSSAARQVIEGWTGCRMEMCKAQFEELWQQFMACERSWRD